MTITTTIITATTTTTETPHETEIAVCSDRHRPACQRHRLYHSRSGRKNSSTYPCGRRWRPRPLPTGSSQKRTLLIWHNPRKNLLQFPFKPPPEVGVFFSAPLKERLTAECKSSALRSAITADGLCCPAAVPHVSHRPSRYRRSSAIEATHRALHRGQAIR